jgi:hypothetical protein
MPNASTREAQATRYWLTPAGCLAAGGHTIVAGICAACGAVRS